MRARNERNITDADANSLLSPLREWLIFIEQRCGLSLWCLTNFPARIDFEAPFFPACSDNFLSGRRQVIAPKNVLRSITIL